MSSIEQIFNRFLYRKTLNISKGLLPCWQVWQYASVETQGGIEMPTAEFLAKRKVWTENRKRKLFANKCCNSCGKPDPDFDKHPGKMCDACLARIRNKIGYNPWRPGGKGRPPRSFVSADDNIMLRSERDEQR